MCWRCPATVSHPRPPARPLAGVEAQPAPAPPPPPPVPHPKPPPPTPATPAASDDATSAGNIYRLLSRRSDLGTLFKALAATGLLNDLKSEFSEPWFVGSGARSCRMARVHLLPPNLAGLPCPRPILPARPCADGDLDATLFAPTDDAFAALLKQLDLSAAALLNDTSLVTDVLSYHIIPDEKLSANKLKNGKSYSTLLKGKKLKVRRAALLPARMHVGCRRLARMHLPPTPRTQRPSRAVHPAPAARRSRRWTTRCGC